MVAWGGPSVPTPYLISLAPLAVMLVMSFALSSELLRADALARELRESRERMNLATRELDRVSRLTAMGEFAATIAHETVQPITAIMANAKAGLHALSRNAAGLDDARDSLLSVVELGRRVAAVIQRNRELFQHRTVRRAPLDINEVIEEARSIAEWRLDDNAVSVDVILTRPLPTLSGDRVELQQVLLNLIANAIDAVQSRPAPRIRIRSSIDGDEVRVEVADNGVGLGGVDVAGMFALSYTTKPEGTGVGLSVSRAIVDAHGGRIWAESNADGGASLCFTIPAPAHDVPTRPLAAAHVADGASTTADASV
jgi:C4-dicarboxylate-specific signal transduction histidine kinase